MGGRFERRRSNRDNEPKPEWIPKTAIGKRVKADFLVAGSVEEYRALPVRQVRLRLSLIHAPSGREVLADTVEAKDAQPKPAGDSNVTDLAKAAADRLCRSTLRVEARLAAEQFVGPWPHYAK